jgi:hypothetical protein
VFVQVLIMGFSAWTYDEGLCLYGGLQVLHGQIPYRDFFSLYPPGEFYMLAGVFRLFGVSVLCDRVLFALINAATTVLILYVLRRLTGRVWLNRAVALGILLWLNLEPAYAFPVYPAMTLILGATACMVTRWQGGRSRLALWAGVLLGLAALFRHDLALFALVALAGASVADGLRTPRGERPGLFGDSVRMALGSGAVVMVAVMCLLIYVRAHDLYYSLIYVPVVLYPKIRSLPFPRPLQVLHGFLHPLTPDEPGPGDLEFNVVYLPVVAVLAALPLLIAEIRKPRWDRARFTGVLALTLLSALLFVKGVVRVSPIHMIQGVVPAVMLLTCLVVLLPRRGALLRGCVACAVLWAVFCELPAVRSAYYTFRHNLRMYRGSDPILARACHPAPAMEALRFHPERSQAGDCVCAVRDGTG